MPDYLRKILRRCAREQNVKPTETYEKTPLSRSLEQNLNSLRAILGDSADLVVRLFDVGGGQGGRAALVFIQGLVKQDAIEKNLLKPLMAGTLLCEADGRSAGGGVDAVLEKLVTIADARKAANWGDLIDGVLGGSACVMFDAQPQALLLNEKEVKDRAVQEPETESVVRGPRTGFTESLQTNTSMLRRVIKNPKLRLETLVIGEQTQTSVCIAYIEDIARGELVQQVRKRLQGINIDSVLDSGYLEEYLEDAPRSIFKTINSSERPDATAGKLLEGRIAILVDGSPFVLTAPCLFIEYFQSAEDYYIRPIYASLLRYIRLWSYFIAILAPAIYVALTTYHQELIPTTLLFTLVSGHENIPFPSLIEAVIMLMIFDIMREAGVRLPKNIGSAVSIVGALVLGESAVSAGLIGPFMVIVVSLTAIASFVVPSQSESIVYIRYFLLLLAGFLGGFGIMMGMLFLLTHLLSIQSFGADYLAPISPLNREGLKDTVWRAPLRCMTKRPEAMRPPNEHRREAGARCK